MYAAASAIAAPSVRARWSRPICSTLPIARPPATITWRSGPIRPGCRTRRDAVLRPKIRRVFEGNRRVHGLRKVWRKLGREGFDIAQCTVEWMLKSMETRSVIRGLGWRVSTSAHAGFVLDALEQTVHVRRPKKDMDWSTAGAEHG